MGNKLSLWQIAIDNLNGDPESRFAQTNDARSEATKKEIFMAVVDGGRVTIAEVMLATGRSRSTVKRYLGELLVRGKIRKIGTRKWMLKS